MASLNAISLDDVCSNRLTSTFLCADHARLKTTKYEGMNENIKSQSLRSCRHTVVSTTKLISVVRMVTMICKTFFSCSV